MMMDRKPFDINHVVSVRVQRSVQSPLYSIFREENTRQTCAVTEAKRRSLRSGRHGQETPASPPAPSTSANTREGNGFWSSLLSAMGVGGSPPHAGACDVDNRHTADVLPDKSGVLYFPGHNTAAAELERVEAETTVPECVTLIGATGFFSKFLAEQYLNRGINVTVMTRDLEKAKEIYVPLAAGERQRRLQAGKGFTTLAPPETTPQLIHSSSTNTRAETTTTTTQDNTDRHDKTEKPNKEPADSALAAEQYVYQWQALSPSRPPQTRQVSLEIVQGDFTNPQHMEYATRHAAVVYYLAALVSPDMSQHFMDSERTRYGGFLRAFDACRRADAYFVALTPLWVHGRWSSPTYWYRRLCTHPHGYTQAVLHREYTLLMKKGAPAPRCYLGLEEGEEEMPMWLYWWRIWRSTELPEDEVQQRLSPVRFSLIRCSDLVYPCLNERLFAAKNNRIDDAMHVTTLDQGNLDARLVANVIVKSVALCRSVVESRVDLAGGLRGGVDMKDAAAVYELFSSFRNE